MNQKTMVGCGSVICFALVSHGVAAQAPASGDASASTSVSLGGDANANANANVSVEDEEKKYEPEPHQFELGTILAPHDSGEGSQSSRRQRGPAQLHDRPRGRASCELSCPIKYRRRRIRGAWMLSTTNEDDIATSSPCALTASARYRSGASRPSRLRRRRARRRQRTDGHRHRSGAAFRPRRQVRVQRRHRLASRSSRHDAPDSSTPNRTRSRTRPRGC